MTEPVDLEPLPSGRPRGGRLTDEERELRKLRRKEYQRLYYQSHRKSLIVKVPVERYAEMEERSRELEKMLKSFK